MATATIKMSEPLLLRGKLPCLKISPSTTMNNTLGRKPAAGLKGAAAAAAEATATPSTQERVRSADEADMLTAAQHRSVP